jgi:hypothetical protein
VGFGGGKPDAAAEVDRSSGSFSSLRFVQDDGVGFGGGKPETVAEADLNRRGGQRGRIAEAMRLFSARIPDREAVPD